MIVCDIRSASNFVDFFDRLADIGLITAIQIRIILAAYCRRSPSFRFLRQKFHFTLLHGHFSAKISHRRMPSIVMYSTHSDISCTVPLPTLPLTCVTFQLLDQFKKFMGPEMIVFSHAAPVSVDHRFAVFFRSNSVFPMVFIGEAAAWPTQHRDLECFQCQPSIRIPFLFGIAESSPTYNPS